MLSFSWYCRGIQLSWLLVYLFRRNRKFLFNLPICEILLFIKRSWFFRWCRESFPNWSVHNLTLLFIKRFQRHSSIKPFFLHISPFIFSYNLTLTTSFIHNQVHLILIILYWGRWKLLLYFCNYLRFLLE